MAVYYTDKLNPDVQITAEEKIADMIWNSEAEVHVETAGQRLPAGKEELIHIEFDDEEQELVALSMRDVELHA